MVGSARHRHFYSAHSVLYTNITKLMFVYPESHIVLHGIDLPYEYKIHVGGWENFAIFD